MNLHKYLIQGPENPFSVIIKNDNTTTPANRIFVMSFTFKSNCPTLDRGKESFIKHLVSEPIQKILFSQKKTFF